MKPYCAVLAVVVAFSCLADGTNQVPCSPRPATSEAVKIKRLHEELSKQEKIKKVSEEIESRLLEMKELRLSPDDLKKANREYRKQKQMEKQGDFWHPDELQRLSPDPQILVPRLKLQKRHMG